MKIGIAGKEYSLKIVLEVERLQNGDSPDIFSLIVRK